MHNHCSVPHKRGINIAHPVDQPKNKLMNLLLLSCKISIEIEKEEQRSLRRYLISRERQFLEHHSLPIKLEYIIVLKDKIHGVR